MAIMELEMVIACSRCKWRCNKGPTGPMLMTAPWCIHDTATTLLQPAKMDQGILPVVRRAASLVMAPASSLELLICPVKFMAETTSSWTMVDKG